MSVHGNKFIHGTYVPTNSRQFLTGMDEMTMQKLHPGTAVAPYIAGDNVATCPTMTYDVCNQFDRAVQGTGENQTHIGTMEYTLIMYCPSLSALRGAQGSPLAGVKLSGMIMMLM